MSLLLDPSALIEQLPRLLPSGDGKGSSIQSPQDALALLSHALLTRLSFRLTSLSEATAAPVESFVDNVLPAAWNSAGPASYTFRYAHEQSSLTFLVKIVPLGARVLIHATALESNRTESYEVELDRFTSRSFWPWPQTSSADGNGNAREPLVNGLVSSSRVSDFVFGFQVKIVQKLVPGLRKDGYEEVTDGDQGSSSSTATAPSSSRMPRQPEAPRRWPEDDDDDDYLRQPPLRNPLIIGDRDLDPLGGRGGFGPPPLFPGGDDGGGMFVGPNHPIFRDRFPHPQRGGGGDMGGGMVPPGARFDPVGPFGQGPLRPGAGRGPAGRPPPGGTGDPDWDELRPPGSNNDYDNMFM